MNGEIQEKRPSMVLRPPPELGLAGYDKRYPAWKVSVPGTIVVYSFMAALALVLLRVPWFRERQVIKPKTVSVWIGGERGRGEDGLPDAPLPSPPPSGDPKGEAETLQSAEKEVVVPEKQVVTDVIPAVIPTAQKPETSGGTTATPTGSTNPLGLPGSQGGPGGAPGGVPGGVPGGGLNGSALGVPGGVPGGRGGVMDVSLALIRVKNEPPRPPYPPLAKRARIQGPVKILLTVGANGVPVKAEVQDGPPMLAPAAVEYAMRWRFHPYVVDGEARQVRFSIIFPFTLN